MDPKVFYGPLKKPAEQPPGSDTETEIEEPPKKFKRLHRRTGNEAPASRSSHDVEAIDISSRAGQRELIRRASGGDLIYIGRALQLGWHPTPEALVASAKLGHADVVGMLLAFGSGDVVFNNITPLAAAIQENHPKVVQLLIDANVSLSWRDRLGRSYGELAEKADTDVRKLLADAYRNRRERREMGKLQQKVRERRNSDTKSREASTEPRKEERREDRRDSRGQNIREERKVSANKDRKPSGSETTSRPGLESLNSRPKLSRNSSKEIQRDKELGKDSVNSSKPDAAASKEPERVRRKTFSLSDYKNLKFTKSKENKKEKEESGALEDKTKPQSGDDSKPVKVTPENTPERQESERKDETDPKETTKVKQKKDKDAKISKEPQSHPQAIPDATGTHEPGEISAIDTTGTSNASETIHERAGRAVREVARATEAAIKYTIDEVSTTEKQALVAQETIGNAAKEFMSATGSLFGAPQEQQAKAEEARPNDQASEQSEEPISQDPGLKDDEQHTSAIDADESAMQIEDPMNDGAQVAELEKPRKPHVSFKELPDDDQPDSDAMDTAEDKVPEARVSHEREDSPFTRGLKAREVSHSPRSPTTAAPAPAPAPVAERVAKRSEERKAFEALLAKRERERKAREAQMLQKLDSEEKRRKSEKSTSTAGVSPTTPIFPASLDVAADATAVNTIPAATNTTTASDSNSSTVPNNSGKNEPQDLAGQLSKLPFILQRLACTGAPQDVGPLFVHRSGSGGAGAVHFDRDPAKFHVLDIQVGALFGVSLHAKYPDLAKVSVTETEKNSVWQFVSSWVCPPECTPAEREEEFSKFYDLPLFWIKGDDVVNISRDFGEVGYRVVPIALEAAKPPVHEDKALLEMLQLLPINLAVRNCLRQQVYAWE